MEKYIIAQFFIVPEKVDAFNTLIVDLVEKTREEDGNIFYNTYQSTENLTDFIFYEKYRDNASFEYHINTEHYRRFASTLNELQSKEPVVQVI